MAKTKTKSAAMKPLSKKKVVKLPIKWIRKIIGKPKKDIQFEFNKDKTLATVTITRTLLIELSNAQLPSKQTSEKSVTKAIFIKNEKGWTLDKIAPPKNSSSNNESSEVKDIESE